MRNFTVKILFLAVVCLTCAFSALAWDDTGHKLTAYIAWEQMTPTARERAIKILMSAPEDSDLSAFYMGDSRSVAAKQRELFMIAATWADIVRDKNFKVRNAKYHHGNWHYEDTFWRDDNGKVELVTDLQPDAENAVERLFAFDKVLRDASASDADKAIALAWILHLGGDIHQPLHDSGRVTKYDPKGDQGGNLFIVSPKGAKGDERVSLHWFWDSIIGRNIPRVSDACDSDYLPPIAQEIMKKYPAAKMQSKLELGKFDEWQKEGFQIASTKLYPASLKFNETPSNDYKKMAFDISEEQIALAGYRLGAMLNQIFGIQEVTRQAYEKARNEYEKDAGNGTIGKGVDDSWIWFKTRATLITTDGLRDSVIDFSVNDSVVTISGTVLNHTQKEKAVSVVKNIDGVKAVKDLLKIKSN